MSLAALVASVLLNAAPIPAVTLAGTDATVPPGVAETDRFAHLVHQGDVRDEIFSVVYAECSHGVGAMKFEPGDKGEAEAKEEFKQCMYDHGFNVVGVGD